jgi:hypothetical protein
MRHVLAVAVLCGGVAVGQELPDDTREIKTLTVKQATALAQRTGSLSLDGLTTLSDEAAKALGQHEGSLYLNGLRTLSDAGAQGLSHHRGSLSLNGLSTLSDIAAFTIGQHKGDLSLNGLASLSQPMAEGLAKNTSGLSLKGLTSLPDEVATAIASCPGKLQFGVLDELTDLAAEALWHHRGNLTLQEVKRASEHAMKLLESKQRLKGRSPDQPHYRLSSGQKISEKEFLNHQDKCEEVTRKFLPSYLRKNPSVAIEFDLLVHQYEIHIDEQLIPAMNRGFWGRDDGRVVQTVERLLGNPRFMKAKEAVWGGTAAKDRYVILGRDVLTHEELWNQALLIYFEKTTPAEVPRVR